MVSKTLLLSVVGVALGFCFFSGTCPQNITSSNISTSLKAELLSAPTSSYQVEISYKNHPAALERAMIHALGGQLFGKSRERRSLLVSLGGKKIAALARHKSIDRIWLINENADWVLQKAPFKPIH